jgi:hypothetical protein
MMLMSILLGIVEAPVSGARRMILLKTNKLQTSLPALEGLSKKDPAALQRSTDCNDS